MQVGIKLPNIREKIKPHLHFLMYLIASSHTSLYNAASDLTYILNTLSVPPLLSPCGMMMSENYDYSEMGECCLTLVSTHRFMKHYSAYLFLYIKGA